MRLAFFALFLAACGGSTDVDAGLDARVPDGSAMDVPAVDAPGADAAHCRDDDGDGHGAIDCGGDDCDDADPNRYPTHTELCDSVDQDCNPATLGPDSDGDGEPSTSCCNPSTSGPPLCGTDCDDTRATINASAIESCNGVDDNCNGMIDEGVPMLLCFVDADGDTYAPAGAASHMACTCTSTETTRAPVGADVDCNDANAMAHPTAIDICDGIDNDCNGTPDDGPGAAYYADCDVDGYGDMSMSRVGCTLPTVPTACAGGVWVARPFDCDDMRGTVHPGATETCNGRDDDCNGTVDDVAASALATDVANCGACGHACRHGTCAGGVCLGDYTAVAVVPTFSCALRGSGAVECWGRVGGTPRSTPMTTTISDATVLAGGGQDVCVAHGSGGVVACSNSGGATWAPEGSLTGVRLLAVGYYELKAVAAVAGDTWSVTVPPFTGGGTFTGAADAVDIAVAAYYSGSHYVNVPCLVHAAGGVDCGMGGTVSAVPGLVDATSIACSAPGTTLDPTCFATKRDGTVASWSWLAPVPTAAATVAGPTNGVRARADSTVGDTVAIVLGDGRLSFRYAPTGLFSPPSSITTPARDLAVAADHDCALLVDDSVVCWGDNTYGQLGDGTTTSSGTPVTVSGS